MYTGSIECPRDVRAAFVEQGPPSPSGISFAYSHLGVVSSTSLTNNSGGKNKTVYEVVRRFVKLHLRLNTTRTNSLPRHLKWTPWMAGRS